MFDLFLLTHHSFGDVFCNPLFKKKRFDLFCFVSEYTTMTDNILHMRLLQVPELYNILLYFICMEKLFSLMVTV